MEPSLHVSQKGCPGLSWNLPDGQSSQLAALLALENCIAEHALHVRSAVAFGGDATRSPFVQVVCGRQKPLPMTAWYSPAGHGSHAAAFSVAENRPAAQAEHALPEMDVPGLHAPQ
jgi:hypothetical protein